MPEQFYTRNAKIDADLCSRREGRPISDRSGHIFQNNDLSHIFGRLELPKVRPLLPPEIMKFELCAKAAAKDPVGQARC